MDKFKFRVGIILFLLHVLFHGESRNTIIELK